MRQLENATKKDENAEKEVEKASKQEAPRRHETGIL